MPLSDMGEMHVQMQLAALLCTFKAEQKRSTVKVSTDVVHDENLALKLGLLSCICKMQLAALLCASEDEHKCSMITSPPDAKMRPLLSTLGCCQAHMKHTLLLFATVCVQPRMHTDAV